MTSSSGRGPIRPALNVFRYFLAILLLGLVAPLPAADEFWLLQSDGATRWQISEQGSSIEASTPVLNGIRSGAVSADDGSVWLFDGRRLSGFDVDGNPLAEVLIDGFANGHPGSIHVDTAADRIWIADSNSVHAFTTKGAVLGTSTIPGAIAATAHHAESGRLFVGSGESLHVFAPDSLVASEHTLPLKVESLAVSDNGDMLLVAGKRHYALYSLADGRILHIPEHSLDGGVTHAFLGDDGGWLVGLHQAFPLHGNSTASLPVFPRHNASGKTAEGRVIAAAAGEDNLVALGERTLALIRNDVRYFDLAAVTGKAGRGVGVFAVNSKDIEPPVTDILDPQEGDYRRVFTRVLVHAEDERSDIDYENGIVENSAGCRYVFSEPLSILPDSAAYVCTEQAPDGNLSITASIPDIAGNFSAPVSVNVTVDTVPPQFNAAALQIVLNDDGTVTITLPPGAAEPGAKIKITVLRDGNPHVYELVVGDDGGFELVVPAVPADQLIIEATDRAGNTTDTMEFTVEPPSNFVEIDTPALLGRVYGNSVDVLGHFDGPATAGVVVNGVVANVAGDGSFFANDVPLPSEGQLTLTASLYAVGGLIDTDAVDVDVVHADPALMWVRPVVATGAAPFATTFIVTASNPNVEGLVLDLDGDGNHETAASPGTDIQHVFNEPGIHHVRARALINGQQHLAETIVYVTAENATLEAMQATWNDFNNSMLAGDVESAVHFIGFGQREKYRRALGVLAEDYAGIHASFLEVRVHSAGDNSGSYAVARERDGKRYIYLVRFVRSMDGVWRIASM